MTTRTFFSTAAFALSIGLGLIQPALAAPETYKVDPVHSTAIFKIKHLGVSNFIGRLDELSGSITIDDADLAKSTIEIEATVKSIDTNNEKRDQHLKGPDFFNGKQFPVIAFKSKSIKKGDQAGVYDVTGDLTMHGVTKEVSFKFTRIGTAKTPMGERSGGETTFMVKRSDFGMKFMPDAIGDDVQLTVSIEGVKQ